MLPTRFRLSGILVLAGITGTGGMAPPASTRISARLERVQEQSSPVNRVSSQNVVYQVLVVGGPERTLCECAIDIKIAK